MAFNSSIPKIISGRVDVNIPTLNAIADKPVEFGRTVQSAKAVTITAEASQIHYISSGIHTITTTGFTIRAFKTAGSTGSHIYHWIAVVNY